MVDIVISVAAKVAEYLVGPIIRPLGYVVNYRHNITDLNQKIQSLHLERERLQIPVDDANRQRDEIFSDVQEWLTYAEGIIQKRDDFNEDERKASKSCFYLKSRYQLSKQAKKQAAEIVDKIQEAHNFGGRVSHRAPPPPPPFISSASFKDYEAFQSRESTFNQIMEALRNEDMRMLGVWGMGGVGKTTLVKQVAQQAEEDKLFHKVVLVLHISQTPNITEIQEKIARMLGLKFEAGEDRAGRLMQRLKREKKILVILDDIWEKLGLGKIGIPYGDDHKGCKVLLTSRERQVLSKDMYTQKEFHLQHLSEDEAWNLFKKTAGESVEKPELRPIAVDVAKKCDGLPVAIVTIANALRGEMVGVWENALEELRRSAPTNIRGVTKGVYSCLELSYNHLEGDEVKSLFLLCALLGDGDISMDRLLQFAMCLNLFERTYSWEKAINKLITLVENLKVSSLLLDHEGDGDSSSSLLFDQAFVRMHDVVRDVARSIASKDPHRFVVREAVGSQEAAELREWQKTDECRNCTRISLICRNMDELPQGLVCPQLEFFLLNSSNDDPYLKIPDAFFQDTKQLRILDLSKVSLTPSPSSLGFLSNLQTLRLNQCQIQDITVIGELKKLQVLSLAESNIEQLPNEVAQLSDLRMLDLRYCDSLEVIPRNVISSLSQLEYLSMKGSFRIEWEAEGFNRGERINACLSELKHLSSLRTLELQLSNLSLFPEDGVPFENLNLTRYSIVISPYRIRNDEYKASSRRLVFQGVTSLYMVKCFSKLLKRSQVLDLGELDDTKHVVYELDKEGFVELKYLTLSGCPTVQYILHSSTSVEWVPPPNTFCMLEELILDGLDNLEAVCHGPIPMGSFGNLRILRLESCERLKYVFSLPTQHGRESAFPQLQHLELSDLPELISFYSTRCSGTQESMTFFSQQVALPNLESLFVGTLDNIRALRPDQLPANSFSKLRKLEVILCNKLLNLFPLSVASALVQLEDLWISWSGVEAIVANENEDEAAPLLLFPNLTSLTLRYLHQLKRFCSGRFSSSWSLLKKLEVDNCDKVEILFQQIGLECELEPLFWVEQVAFPSLESLFVCNLHNIRALWPDQLPANSFSKLRKLRVSKCNKLLNLFPLSMASALMQLEDLHISGGEVEAIVTNENEDEAAPLFLFPNLTSLTLRDLHQLKRFCSGRFSSSWPLLKKLEVLDCDKVEILFQQISLECELEPLFWVEQVALPGLESLYTDGLDNIRALCLDQLPANSFSKLRKLQVRGCNKLLNLFPVSVASALVQLEDLYISASGVEAIVANENEDEASPLLLFPNLTSLTLFSLHQLKRFCSGRFSSSWPLLKELEVVDCDKVEILFQQINLECELEPLFWVEQEAFPNLEELTLSLKGTVEIWRGQFSRVSFSKLSVLTIKEYHGISVVIPSNMVQILHNLEKLEVRMCDSVNEVIQVEIVGNDGHELIDNEIEFTRLKSLTFYHLPNLKSFCSSTRYVFKFPSLETMKVGECHGMEFFCKGVLNAPRLKSVQDEFFRRILAR
ncbi:probable disease resistance protein At4g27220 isoform X3 [Vitis vinifera]|uniref:probable disease resistance protein At4g27220 isoform X3 n=1 Tax=Vitis vinifera TaxID=29760 RepID=UPI002882D87E|nr:probable disease resistance protein At4g27220 isoform X3 [Vitis vinifera]